MRLRLAIAMIVTLACMREAEAGDPSRVWWTIETDHFVIHYYDPLEPMAKRLAVVAERAHEVLAPALGREPGVKTQLVLIDDTDGANGFATVLPRNRITLFATSPAGDSSLNDHDDWLYGLVAHEYTHILHLDSISGLPKLVNKILGKTWAPNQIMPRWVIEGFATYEESMRSSTGRTRSNAFDMFVRAAVLRHEQEIDLDEVTNGPYDYPRGNAGYLYGGKFLQYVFDRFGDDKAKAMSWVSGGQAIPFGVNRTIYDVTGNTFDALWDDWKGYLRDKYTTQLEAVERAGVREGRRLTFDTDGHQSPQYSRDGKWLYWRADDGTTKPRIRKIPVGGNVGDAIDVVSTERFGGWVVMDDGSVVYEQTDDFRREYDFQDLWYRDGVSGDVTRLTHGLRARDPAVSPDGKRVAFTVNGASHSELAVMPLAPQDGGAEYEIVYEGGKFDQALQAAWSPDGTKIAFSAWKQGGYRDIELLDVASGEVTDVTHDRAIDGDPAWSHDGKLLYFSSDRTGIYNIYAMELDGGALWQVTNVIGGAFDPAVSPDGTRLAYHGFDAGGYDLWEIANDRDEWTPAKPYVDERPPPSGIPDDDSGVPAKRPYRALETIAPESYTVELSSATSLGTALTMRVAGGDVAGLHAWSLGATVGFDEGDVNLGAAYSYGALRLPLRMTAGRSVAERTGFHIRDDNLKYKEEVLSTTVSLGIPATRSARGSVSLGVDFDLDYRRLVETPDTTPMPGEVLPRGPLSDYLQNGVALRASFNDARGYSESLGGTEGWDVSASIRYDDPAFGSKYRSFNLSWNVRTYQRLWGQTPVLSFRYAGGVHAGDVDRGDTFGLGGTPDQDVASAMIGQARVSGQGYLHGYEPRVVTGDSFQLLNVEYRQRLWVIEKGLSTIPIYIRRLHMGILGDAGAAYDDDLTSDQIKLSVGASLRLDVLFGWFASGSFDVGYARGLSSEGIDETWFLLTSTL